MRCAALHCSSCTHSGGWAYEAVHAVCRSIGVRVLLISLLLLLMHCECFCLFAAKQKIMSIKEKVGSKLDSTAQQRSSRMGPMRTDFGSRANYDIRLLDDDDDDT